MRISNTILKNFNKLIITYQQLNMVLIKKYKIVILKLTITYNFFNISKICKYMNIKMVKFMATHFINVLPIIYYFKCCYNLISNTNTF